MTRVDAPRPVSRFSRARLVCAWILVVSPLAVGWIVDAGVDRFAGVSLVALCGIPWVVVIGMPRAVGASTTFAREIGSAALFLPPLAAAAGLDVAQGAAPSRTWPLLVGVIVCALVLGDAARRAARTSSSSRVHAIAWFALVAGPPLLWYALEVGGGPHLGQAPSIVAWFARSGPLGALVLDVHDVAAPLHASIGGPLVLALVASAAAWRGRERVEGREVA